MVLAINRTCRNILGCSYYLAKHRILYCMEDVEDADNVALDSCESHYFSFETPTNTSQ